MMPRAAGFTLVSAIFLMVVLAILAVSLVTMSSVQHASSAQQLQAVRASQAARAGLEWAAARAAEPAGCPAGPTALSPGGALTGFTVSVSCVRSDHVLPAGTQRYYRVDVTAQGGLYGSPDFVMRRAQGKVLGQPP